MIKIMKFEKKMFLCFWVYYFGKENIKKFYDFEHKYF